MQITSKMIFADVYREKKEGKISLLERKISLSVGRSTGWGVLVSGCARRAQSQPRVASWDLHGSSTALGLLEQLCPGHLPVPSPAMDSPEPATKTPLKQLKSSKGPQQKIEQGKNYFFKIQGRVSDTEKRLKDLSAPPPTFCSFPMPEKKHFSHN